MIRHYGHDQKKSTEIASVQIDIWCCHVFYVVSDPIDFLHQKLNSSLQLFFLVLNEKFLAAKNGAGSNGFHRRFPRKEHCSSPRWSKFPWRSSPSSSQRMGQHRSLYGPKWGLDASSGHRLSRPPGMKNPVKTLNFRFFEKMSTWKISGPVYY